MPSLALFAGYVLVVFIGLLGLFVLINILNHRIDLSLLISEKDGAASMSRFQFLIFTFVVGMCLLILTIDAGEFPKLDPNLLGLLGISGGSYVIAKGIQRSKDEATEGGVDPDGVLLDVLTAVSQLASAVRGVVPDTTTGESGPDPKREELDKALHGADLTKQRLERLRTMAPPKVNITRRKQ